MVSMTDTVEYPKTCSCCMRQHSETSDILEDAITINFVLTLVYFGSYAVGMHMSCLGSFLAILLNSMYMISLVYPSVDNNDNGNTEEDEGAEGEEADDEEAEDEEDEEDEAKKHVAEEVDTDLSLKQLEHGAAKSKCLSEEADAVLYEKLYEIVQETQRRNEARCRALTRTPTSSSLAAPVDSEEDYADIPPLIHETSVLRYRGTAKDTSIANTDRIPSFREILEGYNSMDTVD